MKISSASKKVLASALSAAMVVAFAPTVAFATIPQGTDNVTVKFDVNGGTVADVDGYSDSHTGTVESAKASVNADGKLTVSSINSYNSVATKGGAAIDYWFYDADGNGKFDKDTSDVKYGESGLDTAGLSKDTTEITLKAAYKEATIADGGFAIDAGATETVKSAIASVSNLSDSKQYYATLTLADGTALTSNVQSPTGGSTTFDFAAAISKAGKTAVAKGTYTFNVYANGGNEAVATKSYNVCQVTLTNGKGYGTYTSGAKTAYLVLEGTTYDALYDLRLTAPQNDSAGGYTFQHYVDANGVQVADGDNKHKVTADATLTAVYDNLQVAAVSANVAAKILTFETVGTFADLGGNGHYEATVTGPDGFSKTLKSIKTNGTSNDLSFGAQWESDTAVTAELAAGTYTVSIAPVAEQGKELTPEQKAQEIDSASTQLVAVTYDLDGGSWKADKASQAAIENLPAVVQVGDSANISSSISSASGLVKAPDLKAFKKWTFDGKDAAEAGSVTSAGLTVKAVWQDAKIAKPEVTVAESDGKYTFTVTAAENTTIQYGISAVGGFYSATKTLAPGATITVDPTKAAEQVVTVKAFSTKSDLASDAVSYIAYSALTSDVESAMTEIMNTSTSASAANKPVRYGDTLTTLKSDAVAAVKAAGYQTEKGWTETELAVATDALAKVAGVEAGYVEAMKTAVKGADGKYSYITAATLEAAEAGYAAIQADYAGFNGADADSYKQTCTTAGVTLTQRSGLSDYVAAFKTVTNVAKAAAVTVAEADVTAAAAVTAQLQAAKDATAAKAAIEAYQALTDTQKALVSAADVTAAQQIVADQEKKDAEQKLIDAQDEAAVAGITGKTVKAKSKKKVTAKLKGATSKSGNVVTFSKKSGNAKVKIAKGGKITVKKGLKKGKKYTVKVTASCGNATKVVKVVVKVVK